MLLAQTASISGWGAQASALGQARRPSQALLGEPSRLSCPPSADGMHPDPCAIARTSHRLHPGPAGGRRRRCGTQPSGRPRASAPVSGMPLQRPWMGTAGPAMLQCAHRAGQRFGFDPRALAARPSAVMPTPMAIALHPALLIPCQCRAFKGEGSDEPAHKQRQQAGQQQAAGGAAATVTFKASRHVAFGQVLKVVGSAPQLGAWDCEQAPGEHGAHWAWDGSSDGPAAAAGPGRGARSWMHYMPGVLPRIQPCCEARSCCAPHTRAPASGRSPPLCLLPCRRSHAMERRRPVAAEPGPSRREPRVQGGGCGAARQGGRLLVRRLGGGAQPHAQGALRPPVLSVQLLGWLHCQPRFAQGGEEEAGGICRSHMSWCCRLVCLAPVPHPASPGLPLPPHALTAGAGCGGRHTRCLHSGVRVGPHLLPGDAAQRGAGGGGAADG